MLSLPEVGFSRSIEKHNVRLDGLCDWIEGSLLFSKNVEEISVTDVIDILREGEIYDSQDFANVCVSDAWSHLAIRERWLRKSAPFRIEGNSIVKTLQWSDALPYSFCIMLSLQKWHSNWARQFTEFNVQGSLFEDLTAASVASLLPGWEVMQTGWARTRANKIKVVAQQVANRLCDSVANVEKWVSGSANEAGLDVLCFRPFGDNRGGMPVYMLQCASGKNELDRKMGTPNIELWKKIIELTSEPRRAFAMPFALLPHEFPGCCAAVQGMFLDRYRLVSPGADGTDWTSKTLKADLKRWLKARVRLLPLN